MSTHLSYYERNLPEVVLGGIPLIRAHSFRNLGQEYWRSRGVSSWYTAGNDLERLQRLLNEKGEEKAEQLIKARKTGVLIFLIANIVCEEIFQLF